METNTIQKQVGVRPKGTLSPLAPRQEQFIANYFDADSPTFGNCYRSAVRAGYSEQTARNFMHLKPAWLSENIGNYAPLEPQQLLEKLSQIISSPTETTQNKLRAIDMMMKHRNMYMPSPMNNVQINIQNVLD